MKTVRIYKFICGGLIATALLFSFSGAAEAAKTSWSVVNQITADSDGDGISDWKENNLYHTSTYAADTDGDKVGDAQELQNGTDPNTADGRPLDKHIYISLKYQELRYYTGPYLMDDFLVSTGIPGKDTPTGEFSVLRKVPSVLYQGDNYYYPDTKWNLMFWPTYYVHGAYWHRNFGYKMSHGCVNVSYTDVKPLYDWAEVGTPVTILAGDFPGTLTMNFPSNTLVLDGGTIYLIANGRKYGFTSMAAFTGLGYSGRTLERRSTSGIDSGYVLNSGTQAHVPGSWIISGQTVYYVADAGLIPVSTWNVFLSNAAPGAYFLRANTNDMSRPTLEIMHVSDTRVSR